MPPNAKSVFLLQEPKNLDVTNVVFETLDKQADAKSKKDSLVKILDEQADTNGLSNVNGDAEDWTDVKHSERKKRDRLLDDGILIELMKKSDYQGFKRLFINLSIMAITAYAIHKLNVFLLTEEIFSHKKFFIFISLYIFYGFQFQCFAFAGQHEFLHRNAFKSKWINDLCLFYTGVFCFEFGKHERVMHKQHHTFTNNIYKDPELTSYYTREELQTEGFRNVPFSRFGYIRQFLDIFTTFKCRFGRIVMSALGIPVDYSGFSWSLENWSYSDESGIMRDLQQTAMLQILHYVALFCFFGQTKEGIQSLLFWWVVPVFLGYPVVNYFRNLEHADCEVSEISNCLRNTRSVRSNLIIRTLLWDTNYHAEHHCYPMVPFFNLHKLNKLMYDHVIHNERDHFTTQNWACLKPNGWIDKQRKMMNTAANKVKPKSE